MFKILFRTNYYLKKQNHARIFIGIYLKYQSNHLKKRSAGKLIANNQQQSQILIPIYVILMFIKN